MLLDNCPAVPSALRRVVISRLRHGADIGYRGDLRARVTRNNKSAETRRDEVSAAIAAEVRAGTTCGPFPSPPLCEFVVNALSARDKDSGGVRLILDLSQPRGDSVNDGINPDEFRVSYTSVDEASRLIFALGGRGALLAKADIKAAFKLIPVRADQWRLLGFKWDGAYYYQRALCFGSRSSPRIFADFADCLLALFQQRARRAEVRAYMDDFWLVAPPGSPDAATAYRAIRDVCSEIRVPLASDKCVAPTTRLTLLGVTLDTEAMTIALPDAKRLALQQTIAALIGRRKCTKRELQSVIGRLVHAAKCVVPGRAFTRRLLDLASSVTVPTHRVRLNAAARADLVWWARYLPQWNGTFPVLPPAGSTGGIVTLHTDSSRWGTGAWTGQHWWLYQWPPGVVTSPAPSMTFLELLPILVSCQMWGGQWRGRRLQVRCDNFGAVGVVRRGWSGDSRLMAMVRHLLFSAACGGFHVDLLFLPTTENGPADALSRGNVDLFRSAVPAANAAPDPVPPGLRTYLDAPEAGPGPLTGYVL